MAKAQHSEKYLTQRGGVWYYQRWIPKRFSHVDSRQKIRFTLHTESVEVARLRRDALAEADKHYWTALAIDAANNDGVSEAAFRAEKLRYKSATARALAHGFQYRPAETLAADAQHSGNVGELLNRIEFLEKNAGAAIVPAKQETEAILGGVAEPARPRVNVSDAFEVYLKEIAFDEQKNKSPKQQYSWEKTKRTSTNYFIDAIGDVAMEDITRDMATSYRSWWIERMIPGDEQMKPTKPNTANRHIGNMRRLYEDYFTHVGEEERPNPFRKMFFKEDQESNVPSFENDWVRERVLSLGLFDDLNDELRLMIYVLIETGARTSEICNLQTENIHLDNDVPYISIQPKGRELKTWTSKREIPLVGVALEAMKEAPTGFPRYQDKGELVSANLMKAFRKRDLLPTPEHVIYSFRHAFEDRMLEADIDFGMRCYLMGHKNPRPDYGKKGSIEYRRNLLLKIAHPYNDGLFKNA